jgi:hypothetical protein
MLSTSVHGEALIPDMRAQSDVTVPVVTLDGALSDLGCELVPEILLKLDVQGFEDRVLRGATSLLGRVNACLLEVSLDDIYVGQARFKDLVDVLDGHGLHYAGNLQQSYGDDGRVMWLDALFARRR